MKSGRWLPWAIAAALAAVLLYKTFDGPMSLDAAATQNLVSVGVVSTSEHRVALTVSRAAGASGKLSLVLPAGTIIGNANPREQRMMTATTVTLALSDEKPTATVDVEVYCLDQFALTPTTASSLSLPMEGNGVETEEANPVRKLAQCLEGTDAGYGPRQLAIWLVAGGYPDDNDAVVREKLVASYRTTINEQAAGKLADIAKELRSDMPDVSQQKIDAAVERYRSGKLATQVEQTAQSQADKDLAAFRGDARSALQKCDADVADRPFFASSAINGDGDH